MRYRRARHDGQFPSFWAVNAYLHTAGKLKIKLQKRVTRVHPQPIAYCLPPVAYSLLTCRALPDQDGFLRRCSHILAVR